METGIKNMLHIDPLYENSSYMVSAQLPSTSFLARESKTGRTVTGENSQSSVPPRGKRSRVRRGGAARECKTSGNLWNDLYVESAFTRQFSLLDLNF